MMDERPVTWNFVMAFLLGSLFASITADPSDILFFSRINTGKPFTGAEAAVYWYWLPFIFYAILLTVAFVAWRSGLVKPRHFIYGLIFLTGVGAIVSMKSVGWTSVHGLLIIIPMLISVWFILYRRGVAS